MGLGTLLYTVEPLDFMALGIPAAGCIALVSIFGAIDDVARRFYQHFGFAESPVDPYQLLLLLNDLRKAIHPAS